MARFVSKKVTNCHSAAESEGGERRVRRSPPPSGVPRPAGGAGVTGGRGERIQPGHARRCRGRGPGGVEASGTAEPTVLAETDGLCRHVFPAWLWTLSRPATRFRLR